MKDFFISYTGKDGEWAEWIAWTLEEAGYSVMLQAWDFRAGGNFMTYIQTGLTQTHQTIAVLSQQYPEASFTQAEWEARVAQDPTGKNHKLIPVRVEDFEPPGLLRAIVYIDLCYCNEQSAKQRLLKSLKDDRMKPEEVPPYPGKQTERQLIDPIPFPKRDQHLNYYLEPASQNLPKSTSSFKAPQWTSILLIISSWIISLIIGNEILINPKANLPLTLTIVGGVAGGIDGFITKLTQSRRLSLSSQDDLVLIMRGCIVGGTSWLFASLMWQPSGFERLPIIIVMTIGAVICHFAIVLTNQRFPRQ